MAYRVPADTSEKEKIIGGVLDLGQFIWCLIGVGASFLVFGIFSTFLKVWAFIPALMALGAFAPFVFKKVDGISYPTYLRRKRKFNKMNKKLPNIRTNREWL